MTLNREEPRMKTDSFGGIDRKTDQHDLPLGKFRVNRNFLTKAAEGKMETRPGFMAVSDRLFDTPFAILPGAAGGRTVALPTFPDDGPFGNLALTLVATPNKDLKANAGNPQTVTFTVYGGADLDISTYNWDVSYDGASRSADYSGASTSQSHDYTAGGTYRVVVWGTGSDSKEYSSSLKLTIYDYDEGAPTPATIPEPPPDPHDGDGGSQQEQLPPTIEAAPIQQTVESGSTLDLAYYAQRASTVYFYDADGTETELTNKTQGHVAIAPTESGTYTFLALNDYGTASAACVITVGTAEVIPGWLKVVPVLDKHTVDGDDYYATAEVTNFNVEVHCMEQGTNNPATFPAGNDPVLLQLASVPADVTDNLSGITPTFDANRNVATFSNVQLTLPSGETAAVSRLKALLNNIEPEVSPGYAEVLVYEPTAGFTVTIVDEDGTDLTEVQTVVSGDVSENDATVTATFYLKIEATEIPGGGTKTDFSNDVQLSWSLGLGYPTDENEVLVQYPAYGVEDTYSDDASPKTLNSDVVPGSAFLAGDAGFCVVKVQVTFKATQDYSTAHYLNITLDAAEIGA